MQAKRKNTPAFLTTTVPRNNRQRYLAYQRRLEAYKRSNVKKPCYLCEALMAALLVYLFVYALPHALAL